jgi:1-phosphofructokinase family hexose kinase
VLVVTPNLCFDRTLWVDTFAAGTVSRPTRVEVTAGGKGVNVVRTLRDLGATSRLLGLLPAGQGAELRRLLEGEGTDLRAVPVGGSVRSATIVLEAAGRATVLNEPGPVLGTEELDDLLRALDGELAAAGGPTLVACSGSLPPGLPDDTYGRVTETAHAHGAVVVVDAARAALAAALPFGPDVVTPNLAEAESLLDGGATEHSHHEDDLDESRDRAMEAARRLLVRGARRAVVTVGAHGVAWVDADGTERWEGAHEVEPANPIGAGDSFVGGLLAALDETGDWCRAIRYAVAVAGAAVEQPTAGRVSAERVRELLAPSGVVA